MKYHDKLGYLAFVDKDNNLQGIDSDSGGYPYIANHPSSIKIWQPHELEDAEHYLKTINHDNKGYKLVRVYMNFGAL